MRDERIDDLLADAVTQLREPVAVRGEWRDALLARAAAERRTRRISLSIPSALAAAAVLALAGAGAMRLVMQRGHAAPSMTTAAAQALPVRFSVVAPSAASVSIVGDFNGWNPTALPMRRSADGRVWEVEVRLPLGRYSYAFMIDGRLAPDPRAPRGSDDDFGTPNSVLMVRGS